MKKYRVSVCWMVSRTVEVEADSDEEARDVALDDIDQPIALYGGCGGDYMDVEEPYVPDDDWACEEVEE